MTSARERVRTGEVTQAVRDTAVEVGAIRKGDWIALSRDGIVATTFTRRRGVRVARQARRRRQRDRHRAGRVPTPRPRTRSGSASTSRSTSRTSKSSSTTGASRSTGTSSAWNSGRPPVPTGDPPLTLRDLREIELARLKGVGPALEGRLADMGLLNVLDLLQHYPRRWIDRTKRVEIAALEVGRGGDGHRRGALDPRSSHAQPARAGGGRDPRRLVAAQRHVLQPGVAREATRGRHRGVAVRQARRVPRQAPDDDAGGRRARPRRRRRRQDRRDPARLPAVGEGRGVHLAAAHARGRGARQVQGARLRRPSTRRCSTATTSSIARSRCARFIGPTRWPR